MITLYTTHCPKCKVLADLCVAKGLHFIENTNVEEMEAMGITMLPVLKIGDKLLNFSEAYKLVKSM